MDRTKHIARCGVNGKRHVIGYFNDLESAQIARNEFAKSSYREFYHAA
jgi:hypothetical protein